MYLQLKKQCQCALQHVSLGKKHPLCIAANPTQKDCSPTPTPQPAGRSPHSPSVALANECPCALQTLCQMCLIIYRCIFEIQFESRSIPARPHLHQPSLMTPPPPHPRVKLTHGPDLDSLLTFLVQMPVLPLSFRACICSAGTRPAGQFQSAFTMMPQRFQSWYC